MMIEFDGLRLLAALKHLIAAGFLPDLNSTDPNPYLETGSILHIKCVPCMIESSICSQSIHEALSSFIILLILSVLQPL